MNAALDVVAGDLVPGAYFTITEWCGDMEIAQGSGLVALLSVGTEAETRKNRMLLGVLMKVLSVNRPNILVRMYSPSGVEMPHVLRAGEFNYTIASEHYVKQYLKAARMERASLNWRRRDIFVLLTIFVLVGIFLLLYFKGFT